MNKQRGFSLVEIMVGLVIGMIGVVVIMQILETAERQKRTTASGTDAQVNGTIALYALERDIRLAGYGLASVNLLNCRINFYNSARTPNLSTFTAAPVVINPAGIPVGDTGSDVLQIAYGNSGGVVEGATLATSSPFVSAGLPNYGLNNSAGLAQNEFVIFAETAKLCWLAQITDPIVPPNIITRANQWNQAAGTGVTSSNVGRVFNAGRQLRVVVYAVRNGRLTQCDMLASPCEDASRVADGAVWVEISPGIVGLTASYGRDDRIADPVSVATRAAVPNVWDQTAPNLGIADAQPNLVNACDWVRIPVLAIALLARGSQLEATAVTAAAPQWRVGNGGSFNMAGLPGWQNSRYKVLQTVVPIRNILWMARTGCLSDTHRCKSSVASCCSSPSSFWW